MANLNDIKFKDKAERKAHIDVTLDGQARTALAKTFSTGSQGYHLSDKVVINGERYQVSLSVVRIGSRPTK